MSESKRIAVLTGIIASEEDVEGEGVQSFWALNGLLFVLGTAIVAVAFSFLDAHDQRLLYNPWTYVIATPVVLTLLSTLLSALVSRLVEKSMQMAFLLSVLLHLGFLVYAVNIVVFSKMWPDMLESLSAQREQLKRQNLQANQYTRASLTTKTGSRPDYLRPVPTVHQPTELESMDSPTLALARSEKVSLVSPAPQIERTATIHLIEQARPAISLPSTTEQSASLSRSDLTRQVQSNSEVGDVPSSDAHAQEQVIAEPQPAEAAIARNARNRATQLDETLLGTSPSLPSVARQVTPSDSPGVQSPSLSATLANLPPRSRETLADIDRTLPLALPGDRVEYPSRDVAGGRTGPAASLSLPVQGIPDVATPEAIRPSLELQSAELTRFDRRPANRRPSTRLAELGAPQSPTWNGQPSVGGGVSGRSPIEVASDQQGEALRQDVAGLIGSGQSIERSRMGLASPPPSLLGVDNGVNNQEIVEATASPGQQASQTSGEALELQPHGSALAMSRRGRGEVGSAEEGSNRPAELSAARAGSALATPLDIPQPIGAGGVLPQLDQVGTLLARREIRNDDLALQQIDSQRFTRQNVGGPLAAGQNVAVPRPAFQQRLDRLKDREALEQSSMEPQTELAIERGLEFLASHQRTDGSWRLQDFDTEVLMRSDTAATALSLLAFQGAGYTHKQFKYATTVSQALQFLVQNQRANGDLYIPQNPASDQNAWLYSHAIATLALCEAFGMTQDEELQLAAQKAVDFMVDTQDPRRGGWRYQPGSGSDTSVTGWFMMAFKSGQLAGLKVPAKTFEGIEKYLQASQASANAPHLYRYNPYAADTPQQRHGLEPTPVMTSVGLLMRLYTGWSRERLEMVEGADDLLLHLPQNGRIDASMRDTYYWYYATQVMFHMRGKHWQAWHDRLYPLLVNDQIVEGEFAGSWHPVVPTPDLWARFGGRLYVTTMNLLSLEVSYRHLPLYDSTAR